MTTLTLEALSNVTGGADDGCTVRNDMTSPLELQTFTGPLEPRPSTVAAGTSRSYATGTILSSHEHFLAASCEPGRQYTIGADGVAR